MSIFHRKRPITHPIPHPIPKPKPPPPVPVPTPTPVPPPPVTHPARTLLFMSSSWLEQADQPPSWWQDMGFTGLISLVDDVAETALFNPAFKPDALKARVEKVRQQAGDLDVFLSHWCTNIYGPTPFMLPWGDDARWQQFAQNLVYLSGAAVGIGAAGVVADAEWERPSGAVQDPAIAWPPGARAGERGIQYATALLNAIPLELGNYYTYGIGGKRQGYLDFWRAVAKAAPGSLMLAEDGFGEQQGSEYGALATRIRAELGAEMMVEVGLSTPNPTLEAAEAYWRWVVQEARAAGRSLWVYPYSPPALSDPKAPLVAVVRRVLAS